MTYTAYALRSDGYPEKVQKGDIVKSFRNEDWTYQGTYHARKVNVYAKEDPNGDDFWPNMEHQEFYANVFELGIKDDATGEWTFEPEWAYTKSDSNNSNSPVISKTGTYTL